MTDHVPSPPAEFSSDEVIDRLQQLAGVDVTGRPFPSLDEALARLDARCVQRGAVSRVKALQSHNARRYPSRQRAWLFTATGLVVALATFGVSFIRHIESIAPRSSGAKTYRTMPGQYATVILEDQSKVILAPATMLSVAKDASGRGIAVQITGRALFTVSQKENAPFTVQAGNAVTRVLGTTFLVQRYTTDHTARVIVMDGKVSVQSTRTFSARTPRAILVAGSLAEVSDSGNVQITPNIAVEEYTAWTSGHLVFRQTPVRDIIVELSRAYGADIRLTDSTLAARALTWTVPIREKSLASALELLATLLDAHITHTDRVITILPGASATHRSIDLHSPSTSERQYGR